MTTSEHRRTSAGGRLGARTWTAVLAGLTLVIALVPAMPPSHAVTGQSIGFTSTALPEEEGDDGEQTDVTLTVAIDPLDPELPAMPPGQPVTFTWCTLPDEDGSAPATAGDDYAAVEANTDSPSTDGCVGAAASGGAGEETIPETETSVDITVEIVGDGDIEGDETFLVVLDQVTSSGGETIDSSARKAVITIEDDDPKVFVGDAEVVEGDSGVTLAVFDVTLSTPFPADGPDVTIKYQTADDTAEDVSSGGDEGTGGDYVPQPAPDSDDDATVTIPAGTASGEIVVSVVGDDKHEPDETFELTDIEVVGGGADVCTGGGDGCDDTPNTAIGTIVNDDSLPRVSIGDTAGPEGSAFDTELDFPITLSNPSSQNIDVNWATIDGTATSGEDYQSASDTVEFDAGTTDQTASVIVEADEEEEPDETFLVVLSASGDSVGAYFIDDDQGQGTIVNDDGPKLEITESASTLEGDDGVTEVTLTVALSEARTDGKEVTATVTSADDTATEDSDYQPVSTVVSIPAGETSAVLTVAILGDTIGEDDETFTVTLSDPGNAVLRPGREQATVEILDDDGGSSDGPTAVIDGDTDGQEGAELAFDGSGSSAAEGSITEYAWAFSDGSPSDRGSSITHAFPDDGTYTVALRVTDGSGSTDTAEMQVSVTNADPAGAIEGPTSVEVFETATFTAAATDPGNDELSFAWDLGGGVVPSSGQSATHTFTETGPHDVTLEVTDDDGGVATDTMTVQVTPDSGQVGRDAGPDRISTAVAVSQAHWDAADDAVLATAGNYPDALAGGPLAAKLGAPLLLTPTGELHESVRGELDRLGVERVWILGGPAAISQAVEDQLIGLGYAVHRFEGPDRFVTAAVIAAGLGASPDGEVAIALGTHADPNRAWPDALSAGALAATDDHTPTLLTAAEELPFATAQALEFMGAREVFLLGGTAAISPTVEQQLIELGYSVQRLSGANRYATSVAVAEEALERHPDDQFAVPIVFATGENFPDGLAATALAARNGGVLLLVPGTGNAEDVPELQRFLSDNAHRLDVGRVVGGSAVLTEQVRAQLESAIGGPGHE